MSSRAKILPAFFAGFSIACIIYACKGVNAHKTTSSSPQLFSPFPAKAKDDGPAFENTSGNNAVSGGTGAAGENGSAIGETKAGSTVPKVTIHAADNSTFFFDRATAFRYAVDVELDEGKEMDRDNLRVTMKYMAKVARDVPFNRLPPSEDYSQGRNLVAANDCKTCHQSLGKASVPSFMQVSEKYWENKNAIGFLANKIIAGGSGVWGPQVMSAHPQLSKEEATEIVKYVLSVSVEKPDMEIPRAGREVLNEHLGEGNGGHYIFTATYTDKSGAATPLTGKDLIMLRPSKVEAETADGIQDMRRATSGLDQIHGGSYFVLKDIDLKDVHQLRYFYSLKDGGAVIEVRTDAPAGNVISTAILKPAGAADKYEEACSDVIDPGGKHDLYFVFVKHDSVFQNPVALDWIRFVGGNEVKVAEKRPPVKIRLSKTVVSKKKTSTGRDKTSAGRPPMTGRSSPAVLMAKSDCYTCHRVNQKRVGPAFTDVAKRYQNQPFATNRLVDRILKGGAGNWGQVPMTPHAQLSKKEATVMVTYILSLKK